MATRTINGNAWTETGGRWQILDGKYRQTLNIPKTSMSATSQVTASSTADAEIVTVTMTVTDDGAGAYGGIAISYTAATTDYYLVYADVTAGAEKVRVNKYESGNDAGTAYVAATTLLEADTEFTMTVYIAGTEGATGTIVVYINGTAVDFSAGTFSDDLSASGTSVRDSDFLATSGVTGLYCNCPTLWDRFTASDESSNTLLDERFVSLEYSTGVEEFYTSSEDSDEGFDPATIERCASMAKAEVDGALGKTYDTPFDSTTYYASIPDEVVAVHTRLTLGYYLRYQYQSQTQPNTVSNAEKWIEEARADLQAIADGATDLHIDGVAVSRKLQDDSLVLVERATPADGMTIYETMSEWEGTRLYRMKIYMENDEDALDSDYVKVTVSGLNTDEETYSVDVYVRDTGYTYVPGHWTQTTGFDAADLADEGTNPYVTLYLVDEARGKIARPRRAGWGGAP